MSVFDVPETLTERLRDDARILNKRDRTEAAARIEELEKRATYEETLEAAREYVRDTEALYARIAALEEALRVALSWWEAGNILAAEPVSERNRQALDEARALIGLPRLSNTASEQ